MPSLPTSGPERWLRSLSGHWSVYLEKPLRRSQLKAERIESSLPTFGFFVLLISATVIGTLGLLADNAPVVIGAMVVAPLMNPILSAAFGICAGEGWLIRRSLTTVVVGGLSVVATALLITELVPVTRLSPQIMVLINPSLVDLVVALTAGTAASFAMTRPRISNSIAGVAIAVALVPPLCVVGIGLGLGDDVGLTIGRVTATGIGRQVAGGALILFLANLIGITLAAALVFLIHGYGHWRRAPAHLVLWCLLLALIGGPLSGSMQEFALERRLDDTIATALDGLRGPHGTVSLQSLEVETRRATARVELQISGAPEAFRNGVPEQLHREVSQAMRGSGIETVSTILHWTPRRVERFSSRLGGPAD